ncbi:hypothetical protein GQR58_029651 [Nymphon striatum]|nr:hypothetical protein GQR58_029651 [Nymphon striatum]
MDRALVRSHPSQSGDHNQNETPMRLVRLGSLRSESRRRQISPPVEPKQATRSAAAAPAQANIPQTLVGAGERPLVTSYWNPCHGQVTKQSNTRPSPNGPFWCAQAFEIALNVPPTRNTATRSPPDRILILAKPVTHFGQIADVNPAVFLNALIISAAPIKQGGVGMQARNSQPATDKDHGKGMVLLVLQNAKADVCDNGTISPIDQTVDAFPHWRGEELHPEIVTGGRQDREAKQRKKRQIFQMETLPIGHNLYWQTTMPQTCQTVQRQSPEGPRIMDLRIDRVFVAKQPRTKVQKYRQEQYHARQHDPVIKPLVTVPLNGGVLDAHWLTSLGADRRTGATVRRPCLAHRQARQNNPDNRNRQDHPDPMMRGAAWFVALGPFVITGRQNAPAPQNQGPDQQDSGTSNGRNT